MFDCTTVAQTETDSTYGFVSNDPPEFQRLRFRVVGRDVVGVIQPTADLTQRMSLNGWQEGSYHCNLEPCAGPAERGARVYVDAGPLHGACILGFCGGYDNLTLVPTSGAWIIQDEKTGRPGRGVFLDVQDDTVIVQTSDYLPNGEPTFHMGASTLQASRLATEDTTAALQLHRYADGRYFGGPAQSGHEVANAGDAALSFSTGILNKFNDFGSGNIRLPGEDTKAMRRLELEPPYTESLEAAMGEYLLKWETELNQKVRWVQLTRMTDRFIMNDDGTIQCYRNIGDPAALTCALLPTPVLRPNWLGGAFFKIHPFDRDAYERTLLLRTRDRHGNWLGLGAVSLPGLAIPANQ